MAVKSIVIVCALFLLTTAYIGCIPVLADSNALSSDSANSTTPDHQLLNSPSPMLDTNKQYNNGQVRFWYSDCTGTDGRTGFLVDNYQMKDSGGNWRPFLNHSYQSGFRYKVSGDSSWHILNLTGAIGTCTGNGGGGGNTSGDPWFHLSNNFNISIGYNGLRVIMHPEFAIAKQAPYNDGVTIRFVMYLYWLKGASTYSITDLDAFWKLEFYVRDTTSSAPTNTAYKGSGTQLTTDQYNTPANWMSGSLGMYIQRDSSSSTKYIYANSPSLSTCTGGVSCTQDWAVKAPLGTGTSFFDILQHNTDPLKPQINGVEYLTETGMSQGSANMIRSWTDWTPSWS